VELLVLHAVRLRGFAADAAVAARYGLEPAITAEILLDDEAFGWVRRSALAGRQGWSLTDAGRCENERLLAAELDGARLRDAATSALMSFFPLNRRFLDAVTRWQVRPRPGEELAANDHADWRWDERVLYTLVGLGRLLEPITQPLADGLTRFAGYPQRYSAALAKVDAGGRHWVDEPGIDSAHAVWFELHEDLLATLGVSRGVGT
jgi:hypothetical protein